MVETTSVHPQLVFHSFLGTWEDYIIQFAYSQKRSYDHPLLLKYEQKQCLSQAKAFESQDATITSFLPFSSKHGDPMLSCQSTGWKQLRSLCYLVVKIPCQINHILCVQEIYFCYVKPFRFQMFSLPQTSIKFNSYTATIFAVRLI